MVLRKIDLLAPVRMFFQPTPVQLGFFEAILCTIIIFFVDYTEIDWTAYMQEVSGFLSGERDYLNLKGDTGPLVYPAGFVYVYSALKFLTNDGANILLAQCIFAFCSVLITLIVARIYKVTGAPSQLLLLLICSKRIHSIFVLRLFNDGLAMLLLYLAISLFIRNRWGFGCIVYSLAVSMKMNIFLFAPGLLALLLRKFSFGKVIWHLGLCAAVQLILGAPFLGAHPVSYISKAFELSRVFTYKWTVNYRFLPEEVFVSKSFGIFLLSLTFFSWVILGVSKWRYRLASYASAPKKVVGSTESGEKNSAAASGSESSVLERTSLSFQRRVAREEACEIVSTLFESNMIGIIFSRTYHYQFYVWFFHQVPWLLYMANVNREHEEVYTENYLGGRGRGKEGSSAKNEDTASTSRDHSENGRDQKSLTIPPSRSSIFTSCWLLIKVLIPFTLIEWAFNVYPSTPISSGMLMLSMVVMWWHIVSKDAAKGGVYILVASWNKKLAAKLQKSKKKSD